MSSANSHKLSAEDIKLRGSLLAKNSELLKLHKELVFGGLLSEEEFWETRQGLLRAQDALLKQKRGVVSAFATEETAKPVTGTTGTGDIKYVLTPAIIKNIFESHPILRKAFSAHVKDTESSAETATLTEKEFWIEYFKSKFFNERAVGTLSILDTYYDTECQEKKAAEASENNLEMFSGVVDEMVDVSRSLDDHATASYVQSMSEAVKNDPNWSTIRHFNLHSLKVLQTTKSQTEKPKKHLDEHYVEISDLQLEAEPALATLGVQETFLKKRNESAMDLDIDYNQIKQSILKNIKTIQKRESIFDFNTQTASLNAILTLNSFSSMNQQTPLQGPISEEIKHVMSASMEVLRHFWRAAMIPNAAERSAKVSKMFPVVEQMEAKVGAHLHSSPTSKQALLNLLQVFSVAKNKYQEMCK